MERPIMNPSFLDDAPPLVEGPPWWARLLSLVGRTLRLVFVDLLARRLVPRRAASTSARPWYSRALRAVFYRLMLVPVLIVAAVGTLVTVGTHPHTGPAVADPGSQGAYYDPVDFLSADGTRLEGWLVPVVDARRVLVEREDVLHKRYPAVVLVHDHGATRQQLLPIVGPLHEAGYVLLVLNLRGAGQSGKAGSTFGINEAQDVRAAVELLRRRPFVDPDAVGVLGVGTGATACLLAAQQDAQINVMVVDHPVRQFDDVLTDRLAPKQSWLGWLRPFCKFGFEWAYKVDADSINLDRFSVLMRHRNCLLLDDSGESYGFARPVRQQQIVGFLQKHLVVRQRSATLLRRDELGRVITPAAPMPDADDSPALNSGEAWPPQRSAQELLRGAARSRS
ncbi:MAG TPA: prolyl oligopeptidase family serine peptidase [Tepidisphaeraceae bacterium]|nr:prolyl oligopeptidase family serine peptidase [Tepidisphaeraceae bacterium]